jgi:hypothetical protein
MGKLFTHTSILFCSALIQFSCFASQIEIPLEMPEDIASETAIASANEKCIICANASEDMDESKPFLGEFITLHCAHRAHKQCLEQFLTSEQHLAERYTVPLNDNCDCVQRPTFDNLFFVCSVCKQKLTKEETQLLNLNQRLCAQRCKYNCCRKHPIILGATFGLAVGLPFLAIPIIRLIFHLYH